MKRTGVMILSLALAVILVSSLSSGVAYGNDTKGRDFEVVILDCGYDEFVTLMAFVVTGLQSSTEDQFGIDVADFGVPSPTSCVEGIAVLLKARFKMEYSGGGFNPMLADLVPGSEALFSRYTFFRTRRGPPE